MVGAHGRAAIESPGIKEEVITIDREMKSLRFIVSLTTRVETGQLIEKIYEGNNTRTRCEVTLHTRSITELRHRI